MEPRTKQPVEQCVYETLKNGILQRKLAPGTQLVETTIASKLNASRTPIRNALKRLAADGLIDLIPNKGAFVIQPKIDDLVNAYELRRELESIAINFGISHYSETDLSELESLIEKQYIAINHQNVKEHLALNKAFHMLIAAKSGNKYLMQFTETIIDQINIFLQLYDTLLDVDLRDLSRIHDHKVIVNLIRENKITALHEIIQKHIQDSLDDLQINRLEYTSLGNLF